MEYLLLSYEAQEEGETPDTLMNACIENNRVLRESGYLVLAVTVQPTGVAATLSLRNGQVTTSDTGLSLAGVYLLHARDMNDAIRTARTMPQARLGPIEIRTVKRVET